jgi:hypothetical protein
VTPISAAIATERTNGAGMTIGRVKDDKDDMVAPFLDFWNLAQLFRIVHVNGPSLATTEYAPVEEAGLIWWINLRTFAVGSNRTCLI